MDIAKLSKVDEEKRQITEEIHRLEIEVKEEKKLGMIESTKNARGFSRGDMRDTGIGRNESIATDAPIFIIAEPKGCEPATTEAI